jgi:hypothetical protein
MTLLQNPTGNFWIDNGLVVLNCLLSGGNLPTDVNPLLQQLARDIYRETGKTEEYWDEQSQQVKSQSVVKRCSLDHQMLHP